MFPLKKLFLPLVLVILAGRVSAQMAPAGDVVIQVSTGVYYFFHAETAQPNGGKFIYVNYATHAVDVINPTVSVTGAFSGTSTITGNTLTGQISATNVSLTYGGVTESAPKRSVYGPTRQFAGEWIGNIQDPSTGGGYADAIIDSHGVVFVISSQDFSSDAGVGTIDANGNASIPLFTGRVLTGTFAPQNGVARGSFALSTGGSETYTVVRAVPPRLFNISTRGLVSVGEQVLIGGFIINDGPKTVVIRAMGPSLAQFGVQNPVQSTRLNIFRGGQLIASNTGWRTDSSASELVMGGYAPPDDRESAMQVSLEQGAYTVIVSSADGTSGTGLVEVYGVGSTGGP